jgi:chromosome segregation ATPase
MKNNKFITALIISSLLFVFAGCQASEKKSQQELKTKSEQNEAVSKRFNNVAGGDGTAIDSAVKIAQDYAVLSQKFAELQAKNLEISQQNAKMKDRLTVIEPELAQTKKELEEANNLLVDMRIELNNWKTDTLGFRDEMREADKVQLETLLKILKALGGEVDASAAKLPDVNSYQLTVKGDPNEKK